MGRGSHRVTCAALAALGISLSISPSTLAADAPSRTTHTNAPAIFAAERPFSGSGRQPPIRLAQHDAYDYTGKVRRIPRPDRGDREDRPQATERSTIPQHTEPEALPEKFKRDAYRMEPSGVGISGVTPYAPRFGMFQTTTFAEAVTKALDLGEDLDSLVNIDFRRINDLQFKGLTRTESDGRTQDDFSGDVRLEADRATVEARRMLLRDNPDELIMIGDVDVRRGGSTLNADRLRIRREPRPTMLEFLPLVETVGDKPVPHPLVPVGYEPRDKQPVFASFRIGGTDVDWREKDFELRATAFDFTTARRRGTFHDAHGHSGPLFFGAQELRILGPADAQGDDLWVTTCDLPEPHYRIRVSRSDLHSGERVVSQNGQVLVRDTRTPVFVPRFTTFFGGDPRIRQGTRLRVGRQSELGSFIDVTQWFQVTDDIALAPRLLLSARESFGFGLLGDYNFMNDPASPFFRSRGEFNSLITTEDRGAFNWYHRQEFTPKTVVLGQWEQWFDEDYLEDFERDEFDNRTGPRTFINLTHTEPRLIASATVSPSTTDFVRASEKLPEGTIHLLERPVRPNLFASFDGAAGYHSTNPDSINSARVIGIGRLSRDWNLKPGLNMVAFLESDTTYYSDTLDDSDDAFRVTATGGLTLQGRLQRTYPGLRGFSGFKHLIVPSTTLSYRPEATVDAEDTPRFDDFDDRPGRFRIESTLDNILLGRNAATGQIWPVARLTLFHGNDFENETLESNDYEIDLRIRPRPMWGINAIGEIREIEEDPLLPGEDLDRLLAFVFYDNVYGRNNLNARLGFALTEAGDETLNQEIIYGLGYKLTNNWSVAFEHRFDLDDNSLERQTYSLRRRLHKWEMGISVRDRRSGVDVRFEINLTDFPDVGFGA